MQRLIQIVLVVGLLCGLCGCLVPGYADEGYPGYAPYSYGLPVYVGGYAPVFAVHRPWEGHQGEGHHTSFHAEASGGHAAAPGGGGGRGGGGRR